MNKVSVFFKIIAVLVVLASLTSLAGCKHPESPAPASSSKPASNPAKKPSNNPPKTPAKDPVPPVDPTTPTDPEQPAAPAPIKITPNELLDYLEKLPETTPEQPVTIELAIPEGEEPFVMPDLSKLAEEEVYFDLVIPEGVTDIGESLQGLETLTSVTIPDTVTSLDADTFAGCTGLTSVTVPGSMDGTVPSDIFTNCTGLEEVTVTGSSIESDWKEALRNSQIKTLIIEGDESIGGDVFNPPFASIQSVEEIIIKDGVQSIGQSSFFNCDSLKRITIPGSVTEIGNQAFWMCHKLKEVIIEEGVEIIGPSAFKDCTSLTSITIPDSVTTLDINCFNGCTSLTEITIPDSVTTLEAYAFRNCSKLEKVTIGKGIVSIPRQTFDGCTKLKEITIPANVTLLETDALKGSCFTTMHFENTIGWQYGKDESGWKTIHSNKLNDLELLTLINSNNNLRWNESITQDPEPSVNVLDNPDIKTVNLNSNELIEYITAQTWTTKDNPLTVILTDTTIPDLEPLKQSTVYYILILPEGITDIGSIFRNQSTLISVSIPSTVATIGNSAFNYCINLKSITIPTTVTRISTSAFTGSQNVSISFERSDTVSNRWYINYQQGTYYETASAISILKNQSYSGGTLVREGF